MKSDEYILKSSDEDYSSVPNEAEKAARYSGLDDKSVLRLRLLAEEMICMLPQLLSYGTGRFWIQSEDRRFELHLNITLGNDRNYNIDRLLSVSTSGKNDAAKGIIGKIVVAVESMLGNNESVACGDDYGAWSRGFSYVNKASIWSLEAYKDAFKTAEAKHTYSEDWDELEKSIIANLANDVRVGVRGGKIDIVISKCF